MDICLTQLLKQETSEHEKNKENFSNSENLPKPIYYDQSQLG